MRAARAVAARLAVSLGMAVATGQAAQEQVHAAVRSAAMAGQEVVEVGRTAAVAARLAVSLGVAGGEGESAASLPAAAVACLQTASGV